jgi:hypothetical protein
MGENITIGGFAPAARRQLTTIVQQAIRSATPASQPSPPPAEAPAAAPLWDYVPWRFYAPREDCDVIAFLDDREQVRHVPAVSAANVPAGWRMLYVRAPREDE